MSFSTQRDCIRIPFLNEHDDNSDEISQGEYGQEGSQNLQKISPELSDVLSCLHETSERIESAREAHMKRVKACSDGDSGILSDRFGSNSNDARNLRYNESDDLKFALKNTSDVNNFENLLKSLQREGKFTIEAIMDLLKQYTATITEMMGENQFMKMIDKFIPEATGESTIEIIQQQVAGIVKLIQRLKLPEEIHKELQLLVDRFMMGLKQLLCEKDQESLAMIAELEKVSMDRRNLKISLEKLTNVENKIVNLKTQAAMSNSRQKEIQELREQLLEIRNHNRALCECFCQIKKERCGIEECFKKDRDKAWNEMMKWKCKAEILTDIHQREMLELEKWKLHCSRITIELDKATGRILRAHETKRKLYYAESMRSELENQIEEMMEVIKKLNEKKNSPGEINTAQSQCHGVLTNLLAQSKNTLQVIIDNINTGFPTLAKTWDGKSRIELKKLLGENSKLKRENARLKKIAKRKSNSSLNSSVASEKKIKKLEDNLKRVQGELQRCQQAELRTKEECEKLRNTQSKFSLNNDIESLKEKLKKCQEENRRLHDPQSAQSQLQYLVDELKMQLKESQQENKSLKTMLNVKGDESHERYSERMHESGQVATADLQTNNNSQEECENSNDEAEDSEEADENNILVIDPDSNTSGFYLLDKTIECKCSRNPLCQQNKQNHETVEDPVEIPHQPNHRYATSGSDASIIILKPSRVVADQKKSVKTLQSHITLQSETINVRHQSFLELEDECMALRKMISQIPNRNEQALVSLDLKEPNSISTISVSHLETEISRFQEELHEQNSLLLLAKNQLKAQRDEIRKSKELLQSVQEKNSDLTAENQRLHEEKSTRDAIKMEKDRLNGNLRNQDFDCEELQLEVTNSRMDTDKYRKEFNEKVRRMLEEKAKLEAENMRLAKKLEAENMRLAKKLEDLDDVVDEVSIERTKNRKLEELINELETKIQDISKPMTEPKTAKQSSTHYLQLVEKLKKQVETELNVNNALREQLDRHKDEIESMRSTIDRKEAELKNYRHKNNIVVSGAPNNALHRDLHPVNLPDEYDAIITELRAQLSGEKARYEKLRMKFIVYSIQIEEVEKKLRQKRAIIEQEVQNMPDLKAVSSRMLEAPSDFQAEIEDPTEKYVLNRRLQEECLKSKRVRTKLILEYLKNQTLHSHLKQCHETCAEMKKDLETKEFLITDLKQKLKSRPKPKQPSIQLQLQQYEDNAGEKFSQSDASSSEEVTDNFGILDVAQDFQEIEGQLKEQLRTEKKKSTKLRSQTMANDFKIDDLDSNVAESKQQIVRKNEADIAALQTNVLHLTKSGLIDFRETASQTVEPPRMHYVSVATGSDADMNAILPDGQTTITNLQNHLEAELKRNFNLTSDFSREITNGQLIKHELKQAQKEIRKLCKCVLDVETKNKVLQEELQMHLNYNETKNADNRNSNKIAFFDDKASRINKNGLMLCKASDQSNQHAPSCPGNCANPACRNSNYDEIRPNKGVIADEEGEAATQLHQMNKTRKQANAQFLENCRSKNRVPGEMVDQESQAEAVSHNIRIKSVGNRLQRICSKVHQNGIESLNIRDLTYLHREVYNAGRKMKNSDSEWAQEKCLEFIANLPPIPTNKEGKIIARVCYLESELDSANQVLQHLKKEYEKDTKKEDRNRHRGGDDNAGMPSKNLDRTIFKSSEHNRN